MHSPIGAIAPAIDAIKSRWNGFVGAYPEWSALDLRPYDSPRTLARCGKEWQQQGARVLGGCCGTRPEHVRALKQALESA
jgi:homocysteine S-methyltransferase